MPPVRIPTLGSNVPHEVKTGIDNLAKHTNSNEATAAALKARLDALKIPTFSEIRDALSSNGVTPLNITGLVGSSATSLPAAVNPAVVPTPVPTPTPSPTPTPTLACYMSVAGGQPGGVPAPPNLRWMRGDFCGVTVAGLPAVSGGAGDPSCVFAPYLDRYSGSDQTKILNAHLANGYTHYLLSWPDSRDGNGQSIAQFTATAAAVQTAGFYPVIALFSKDYDGQNPDPTTVDTLLTSLVGAGVIPICKIAWEMNLFVDPGPTTQAMIDHVTGILVPGGTHCYVHFSQGYVAWQAPGASGADFWNANVGKLRGIMHQKDLTWDCGMYQARLADLQVRFGTGAAGWPSASGFGHPFDIVAWEVSAAVRFNGSITETQAKVLGQQAICSPGNIPIQGFGTGGPNV